MATETSDAPPQKKRWNHAITLGFSVDSNNPEIPEVEEAMEALRRRVAELEADPDEAREALCVELPFDTEENEGDWPDDDPEAQEAPETDEEADGAEAGGADAQEADEPDETGGLADAKQDPEPLPYELTREFGAILLKHRGTGKTFGPDDIVQTYNAGSRWAATTETGARYAMGHAGWRSWSGTNHRETFAEADVVEFIRRSEYPPCFFPDDQGVKCATHPGGYRKLRYGSSPDCHLQKPQPKEAQRGR